MDETYFKLDCSFPGQTCYAISKGTKPRVLLKAIKTEKFDKKVMVCKPSVLGCDITKF